MPSGSVKNLGRNSLMFCFITGIVGYYLSPIVDYSALAKIDVSVERLLFYIFPAFVIIINAILNKEYPSKLQLGAFIIIEFGIYLIMGGVNTGVDAIGVSLAIVAAFLYAVYIIMNQHIGKNISNLPFLLIALIGGLVAVSLHYFVSIESLPQLSTQGYVIIFAIALLCTFLPLITLFEGIKRIGGNRVALTSAIGPVFAVVLAHIILNEILQPVQILGGAVIISAVLLLEYKAWRLIKRNSV